MALSGQTPNRLKKDKTKNNKSDNSGIGQYGITHLIIGIAEAKTEQPVRQGEHLE
jgi:hypothetical protein